MVQRCELETVFDGLYSDLYDKLLPYKNGNEGWPQRGKGLINTLKRNIPALQEAGVIVIPERGRNKKRSGGFSVTITKCEHSELSEHDSAETTSKEKKLSESVNDEEPF
ncbi:MAG: hypothetical protein HGB35_09495 [Geobacteraceae bacterium]|nr:hypothetical protein [Geobacteraceae bacterium]